MLPFAHSKSAGQISTQTKLTLDRTERSLPEITQKQLIRESLVFKKNQQNKFDGQNLSEIRKAVEQILDEIRSDVQHNIQKSTPEKIKQLSQHLAVLNVQELERLAQQVSNQNDKVQDIFFDTVAQTGTQVSVAFKVWNPNGSLNFPIRLISLNLIKGNCPHRLESCLGQTILQR